MSRERELLKKVLAFLETDVENDFGFGSDIKYLLAQPEQEQEQEQKPVAWCQMVEGKVQDLLTSFEMKDWLYDKSWIPLYTAPPKREPLSDEKLEIMYSKHAFAMDKQEYMWGFRDAEKHTVLEVGNE